MLNEAVAFSSFSVNDIKAALNFYRDVLGLPVKEHEGMGLEVTLNNSPMLFIYAKPNHAPANYTVMNWEVKNLEAEVDALIGKGIKFEQYTDEQLRTNEKGIHKSNGQGPAFSAWFKDPAGNILGLMQGKA